MLSLVGFLLVLAIIVLLLKGKMSPIVVLVLVPSLAALLIGTNIADLQRNDWRRYENSF